MVSSLLADLRQKLMEKEEDEDIGRDNTLKSKRRSAPPRRSTSARSLRVGGSLDSSGGKAVNSSVRATGAPKQAHGVVVEAMVAQFRNGKMEGGLRPRSFSSVSPPSSTTGKAGADQVKAENQRKKRQRILMEILGTFYWHGGNGRIQEEQEDVSFKDR